MENKSRSSKFKDSLKYYTLPENVDIDNIKILDSAIIKKIREDILKKDFDVFIGGIEVLAEIDSVDNKIIKLVGFIKPIELLRKHYGLQLKAKDLIKCTIEYTPLTDSFNLSKCEILELNEEKVSKDFLAEKQSIYKKINSVLGLMGFNPKKLMFREKLTFLTRIIPLVVKNYSLLEFSQKGLGKTESFNNFNNTYIANSSETSPQLFYNISDNKVGVIENYDVLVLDEVQKRGNDGVLGDLQKYLENGQIPRKTGSKITAETSIVVIGNGKLDDGYDYEDLFVKPKTNLFKNHKHFNKELIDRFNYILPSWGCREFQNKFIKTSKKDILFLEMVCSILRKKEVSIEEFLDEHDLKEISQRAYKSIKNTTEGFIKLLKLDEDEYDLALYLAIEGRYLVEDIIEVIEGKSKNSDIFDEIFTSENYKRLVSAFLNIDEDEIIAITPHEVFYESDAGITVKAFDTVGLEELVLIKEHFEKGDKEEVDDDISLELDYEDSDELEEEYEEIHDEFKENDNLCDYQDDDINYLYGYELDECPTIDLLRTKRIVSSRSLWCPNKSKDRCEDELVLKKRSLICDECGSKYSYKQYFQSLKKL